MADSGNITPLITERYLEEQRALHENDGYGVASLGYASLVGDVINQTGSTEVLDYGCGKGRLAFALEPYIQHQVNIFQYDPAREEFSETPEPRQMVACIDVLEHIEPECLDAVLDDLRRVTKQIGLFTVSTVPAMKTLPDGRNAHLIQQGIDFWLPKLWSRFGVRTYQEVQGGFWVICYGSDELH